MPALIHVYFFICCHACWPQFGFSCPTCLFRYIKEGSTVSVMGVVRRNDNVLMIVPPPEPLSTGCQWSKCILPASLEGIVLRCEDSSKIDVIPV